MTVFHADPQVAARLGVEDGEPCREAVGDRTAHGQLDDQVRARAARHLFQAAGTGARWFLAKASVSARSASRSSLVAARVVFTSATTIPR